MRFRNLLGGAIILSALFLSSCTPPAIGSMGILRQQDGSLAVLLRVCRGSLTTLTLDAINSFPPDTTGDSTNDTWRSAPQPGIPLTPPVSGSATVGMPMDEFAVRADILHMLRASGEFGYVDSAHFDAGSLAALRPGQVLSSESLYEEGDIITTPDEFQRYADEYCS